MDRNFQREAQTVVIETLRKLITKPKGFGSDPAFHDGIACEFIAPF
jgi:hypothetical protein